MIEIEGVQKAHQPRSQSLSLVTYSNVRSGLPADGSAVASAKEEALAKSGGFAPSGLADEPSEHPRCLLTTRLTWLLLVLFILLPGLTLAACREESFAKRLVPPAFAASVDATIRYFGHNFFQILTRKGTSIATDPLAPGMYPDPKIAAELVTVGREHINHNYVPIILGTPLVLRGLGAFGTDWKAVRMNIKDVFVYNIPIYQNAFDEGSIKGAAFVFDVGKLCIAHLGDLSHTLTPKQLKWIGKIDVALTPISGRWTMDPHTAREVIKQLKPKIAIPMHYRDNLHLVRAFATGFPTRHLNTHSLEVSKDALPTATEIVVLTPPGAQSWE